VLAGLLVSIASRIDEDNIILKVAAIVIALSYEPLMNRYFRTFGQMITGTRVHYREEGRKLPLPLAYLRFILKQCSAGYRFSRCTVHASAALCTTWLRIP
jgi:hypothetical protein